MEKKYLSEVLEDSMVNIPFDNNGKLVKQVLVAVFAYLYSLEKEGVEIVFDEINQREYIRAIDETHRIFDPPQA